MSREYVFLNGKILDINEAKLPVKTHAFIYGTSVFEEIKAYFNDDDKNLYLFRMEDHFARLIQSAKIMHMQCPYTVKNLCEATVEVLKKNQHKRDTYIRPIIYKSSTKIIESMLTKTEDSITIFTFPLWDHIDISKGLSVCVSNWRNCDDNAIYARAKVSGCRANAALIQTDARLAGFDDAIVLSADGYVSDVSGMNLFLVQNGKLITNCFSDNVLFGVTRNTIIELARDILNLEIIERQIDRTELYISDEVFCCSTSVEVCPIVKVDNRKIGNGDVGNITRELKKLYFDVVRAKSEKYRKWCTPVYD